MKNQPPKWISRFLKWYCDPNLSDEIQGDALELYNRRLAERNKRYADLLFIRDVLGYFRWTNIKKTTKIMNPLKNLILLQSFMKIGFRNIIKHYVINSISIIGLALSLGIGITALIFYDVQVNMDEFHVKGDRIYQITQLTEAVVEGKTPVLLGPTINDDNPAVEHFTRIEKRGAYVKQRNNTFDEQIAFVDPAFLQVFDFPMIAGNEYSLSKKHFIVISYEMAKKYFANDDPIGKGLQVIFTNEYEASFVVTGVMDKYTDYASFYFDFYIPFENLFDFQQNENQWQATTDATFILTKPGIPPNLIAEGLQQYLEPINAALESRSVIDFKLYPLFDLSEKCHEIEGSVSFTAPAFTRISLAVIALMLIALAVFNFINISIAAYAKRLREIAVRKVIGSNRRQIVFQFFIENLLLCLFSFLLGIYLSMVVFTPGLNYLIPLRIPSSFSSASFMLISLISLFVGIVVVAGVYPSTFISRFSSSHILKGIAKFKRNSVFSRLMLAIQFVLAFITIVGCFVFTSHSLAIFEKGWGYEAEDVLMVRTTSLAQMELMRDKLLDDSKVKSIAVSMQSHVGAHNPTINYQYNHKMYESVGYYVDENYQSVLGLNLKSGRWFDGTGSDYEKSVVVNEAMVNTMNWKDPIGEKIDHQGIHREVIGVVSDFHYRSFHSTIRPVTFFGLKKETPTSLYYLSLKSKPRGMQNLKLSSQLLWDKVAPNEPFVHMVQEEVFASFYEETEASTFILIVLSTIAIILACLGLFGLFSFTIQRRLKEFSIRKVLGATPLSIVTHVSKTYIVIVIISLLIGAPLGYLMIDKLLSIMYPERLATGFSPFFLAFIMTLGTIGLTIAGQIIRAVKVNPTENLRGD